MAKQKFIELNSLELLEEGRFLQQANEVLALLAKSIAAFRAEHGNKAQGAKAEMTMKVVLKCANADQQLFSISTSIGQKLPARPTEVTTAMETSNDADNLTLFVRLSGSDSSHPSQLKLATEDGRTIIDGKAEAVKD